MPPLAPLAPLRPDELALPYADAADFDAPPASATV
jgi:hypothetical protein